MDIVKHESNLPANIEDLTRFVLVGREKLTAVRAEIRAINKIGLAKEVREQKKQEAQDLGDALLDAEAKIGEFLKEIPKLQGKRTDKILADTSVDKSKKEVIKDLGFNEKQAERFETLADNKEIIEEVKATARENDEIPTRTAVLNRVQELKKPHVSNNSGNNEWYTPKEYIDIALTVMGSIDLDPASNDIANKTVNAKTYYTCNDSGLDKEWNGNVWMNPPYSQPLIQQFCDKLVSEIDSSNVSQACVLVNNATETAWFQTLLKKANSIWFIKSRVKFIDIKGNPSGSPLQGQCMLYFGDNTDKFNKLCEGITYVKY